MKESTDWYSCQRCGRFAISPYTFGEGLPSQQVQAFLCGYVREQNERGNNCVEVTKEVTDNILNLAPLGVQEKADRLLQALVRLSRWPGDEIRLSASKDYPLAYSASEAEFNYFVSHLGESGLITAHPGGSDVLCTVTPAAWSRVEELHKSGRQSLKAFVAMSFAADFNAVFTNGIRPAVEGSGYRPLRIDNKEYLGGIFDEIIAEIRESRFIVADLTLQRQGVYYEAGYALGLGLPVVLTCREDDLANVHFDAKHMNIIVWKTPAELVTPLKNRIRAVIGLAPGVAS